MFGVGRFRAYVVTDGSRVETGGFVGPTPRRIGMAGSPGSLRLLRGRALVCCRRNLGASQAPPGPYQWEGINVACIIPDDIRQRVNDLATFLEGHRVTKIEGGYSAVMGDITNIHIAREDGRRVTIFGGRDICVYWEFEEQIA